MRSFRPVAYHQKVKLLTRSTEIERPNATEALVAQVMNEMKLRAKFLVIISCSKARRIKKIQALVISLRSGMYCVKRCAFRRRGILVDQLQNRFR